jgi:hypothetical protein
MRRQAAGTLLRAYADNRNAAIEGVIAADPIAAWIREMMARVPEWTGSVSDLLRIGADRSEHGFLARSGWPTSPRSLAGRLRGESPGCGLKIKAGAAPPVRCGAPSARLVAGGLDPPRRLTNSKEAALSIITGGGKRIEITIAPDCLLQDDIRIARAGTQVSSTKYSTTRALFSLGACMEAISQIGSDGYRMLRTAFEDRSHSKYRGASNVVVTAILAIRNEEAYLANCLRHLVRNGINFVIIDNGSSDASTEIYRRREFASYLVDVQELPFLGAFYLAEQLRHKMMIVDAINTDWVIHLDADEVMHPYRQGESLNEALCRLDAEGWNVVNFDEFVFLPVEDGYVSEAPEHQPMSLYYFFQPYVPRLMRAWRKIGGFSMVEHGGHSLVGADIRLAPEYLALRHYIVRNQVHAFGKYTTRTFASNEIALGWHGNRVAQPAQAFLLPPAALLKRLSKPDHYDLDRSDPWTMHYWRKRRDC